MKYYLILLKWYILGCNSATKKLIFFVPRKNMIEMEVQLPSFLTLTLSEGWRQP
jgi:hypothetical protein